MYIYGAGQMGTAHFMFFDRGTFWVLPFTYVSIPKKVPGRACFRNLTNK